MSKAIPQCERVQKCVCTVRLSIPLQEIKSNKVAEDNHTKKSSATLLLGNPFKSLGRVGSYRWPGTLDMDCKLTVALNCRHELRQVEAAPKSHRHKRHKEHQNHKPIAMSQARGKWLRLERGHRVLRRQTCSHLPIKGRCVYHVETFRKDVYSHVFSYTYPEAKSFVRFDRCGLVS